MCWPKKETWISNTQIESSRYHTVAAKITWLWHVYIYITKNKIVIAGPQWLLQATLMYLQQEMIRIYADIKQGFYKLLGNKWKFFKLKE